MAAVGTITAVLAALTPEQRAFVEDTTERKVALCGRRAGKSHAVAAWLLMRGLDAPEGIGSAFIALSRSSARRILVPALRKVAKSAGITLKEKNEDGQLYYTMPNGHSIWIAGCNHAGEVDKFRGVPFWSVAVDECGFMAGWLEELVEGALDATLLDYQGKLALTSSPGVVPVGYFYDATTGKTQQDDQEVSWSIHHWTVLNNRAIPHAADWLAKKVKRFGWTDQTPIYVREWLGRWVNDRAGLVYPLFKPLNGWDGVLPAEPEQTVLGVDVGYRDAMAFVVVSTVGGKKYVRHAEKQSGMTPNAVVARVQQLLGQFPEAQVVVDEGGAGKGYAVHMREEGIGCVATEKTEKRSNQEWLAGEILCGNLLVDYEKCRALTDEALVLRWGEKGKEDERFPNHACDAALYACRTLRATAGTHGPGMPPPGTEAFENMRAVKFKLEREKQMRAIGKKRHRSGVLRMCAKLCQAVSRDLAQLWLALKSPGTGSQAPTARGLSRSWGELSAMSRLGASLDTA